MENIVKRLLTEVVKDDETATYLIQNQLESRDFKIECRCGGISFSSTIFFSEVDYLEAIKNNDTAGIIRKYFIHYFGGTSGEVPIIGCCQKCGSKLSAKIRLLLD